jgi:hypothetical protein
VQGPAAGAHRKLQDHLLDLARRPNIAMTPGAGEQVEVDIVADVTADLLNRISELHGTVINSFPAEHAIRARVPVTALQELARNEHVKFVRPAIQPFHNQGGGGQGTAGLIEGDAAHKADVARTAYQAFGDGVKVCVISDSMDRMDNGQSALTNARQSHDVPDAPQLSPLPGQAGVGKGEGLAMLEIVHKIAPHADLVFATGGSSAAQTAQNIRDLTTFSRCRIIVDDTAYSDEPPFQDGAISRAINDNDVNALFVSSAANSGNSKHGASGTWEGDFADGGTDTRFQGYRMHRFAAGKLFATVTKPTQRIGLYWSDAWFNSPNEYALAVYDSQDRFLFSLTNHFNPMLYADVSQTLLGYDPTNPQQYPGRNYLENGDKIYVLKKDGSDARYLRLDVFRGQIDPGTDGSTFGHNAAESVISVAAVERPH